MPSVFQTEGASMKIIKLNEKSLMGKRYCQAPLLGASVIKAQDFLASA